MKLYDTIDTAKLEKDWADRYNPELSLLGGRDAAFLPAVQGQVSPYGQPAIGDMPTYSQLYNIMLPYEFTGWHDEADCIAKTGYIGDWSWLVKIRLSGPDAIACLEASTINGYKKFPVGRARHIISITPDGKMTGDGIAFRESEDTFLLTAGSTLADGSMLKTEGFDVVAEDVSAKIYNFHVQGPVSGEVIKRLSGEDVSDLPFLCFRDITIAGRSARIYRGGMSGELGYELFGDAADASYVWKQVVDAGVDLGLRQLGYRTMMLNHLQAFFPTIWVDFLPSNLPAEAQAEQLYRSPVDYGWGNLIDKTRDFPGKSILLDEMANPTRVSRTLEWNSEDVVAIYASLFDAEQEPLEQMPLPVNTSEMASGAPFCLPVLNKGMQFIGLTTNRGYSAQFRRMLSLTVIDVASAGLGNEVYVVYGGEGKRQMMVRATVADVPYKKDNRR